MAAFLHLLFLVFYFSIGRWRSPRVWSLYPLTHGTAAALPAFGQGAINVSSIDANGLSKKGFNNGVQLRILPLGATIVYGQTSPDANGFRYGLRNQLIYNGNPVNMVGSVHAGTSGGQRLRRLAWI